MQKLISVALLLLAAVYYYYSFVADSADAPAGPVSTPVATPAPAPPEATPFSGQRIPASFYPIPGTDADTPAEFLKDLQSATVLKPDNRALLAVKALHRFLGNSAPDLQFVQQNTTAWTITGSARLGSSQPELANMADFAQIKAYLNDLLPYLGFSQWSASDPDFDPGAMATQLQNIDATSLFDVLQELNARAGAQSGDSQVLVLAARALARLAFTGYDLLETSDDISGKALAFLVAAQAVSRDNLALEESLLAYTMGYSAHARRLLRDIDHDAWRYFLQRNDDALANLARNAPADSLEKFLWLKRLSSKDRQRDWLAAFTNNYKRPGRSLHAMATGARLSSFSYKTTLLSLMPFLVYAQVEASNNPVSVSTLLQAVGGNEDTYFNGFATAIAAIVNSSVDGALGNFEDRLVTASRRFDGPFASPETYQSYYRAYYFSSLYRLGLHYLDSQSSTVAARTFSTLLGLSGSQTTRQLNTWYGNLIDAETGQADVDALLQDLNSLTLFGVPPLLRTTENLLPTIRFGSPEKERIIAFLANRMDARISHRYRYAQLAREHLLDLNLADYIYLNVAEDEAEANQGLVAWLGMYYEQPGDILAVVMDEGLNVSTRTTAMRYLARFPAYEDFIWQNLEDMLATEPDEWDIYETYFSIGETFGRQERVIRTADRWLEADHSNPNTFDTWRTVIAKTEALDALGNTEAAWTTLAPIIAGQYGPAMRLGVDLMMKRNDLDGADELSRILLDRYPADIRGLAKRLQVLWSQDRFLEAAQTATNWPQASTPEDWRWTVGPALLTAMTGKRNAYQAMARQLQSAGLDAWKLRELAVAAANDDQYHLAFEIQSLAQFAGAGQIAYDVEAYRFLRQADGVTAARTWLEPRIPAGVRNFAGMMFYSTGEYDLLWDLIPDPSSEQYPESVWLFRAAATLEGHRITATQREQLDAYYRAADDSHYHLLGKYVLGMIGAQQLVDRTMDKRQINEATYYLGLRNLRNGNYSEAVDWFRVSVSTGEFNSGEYRWAYDYLYLMRNKQRSLDVIDRQGDFVRVSQR